MANDAAALRRLSRSPVVSNGELDEDPTLRLTSRQVPASIARLIADPGEAEADGRTLRQLLQAEAIVTHDANNSGDYRRIGPLVFRRGPTGWLLAEIYRGPDD